MQLISPSNAWHSPALTRLLQLLALLPLLQLPLPVLHRHEHGQDDESLPLRLAVHVHQCHHDHDETAGNCHWHFVPFGEWDWLGLPLDTPLPKGDCLVVTMVRMPDFANDACSSAQFPMFDWASLSQPPVSGWRDTGDSCAVTCWGFSASARTYLVQQLCEQRC